ncbi:hypothetical protein CONLIGDRAFT_299536 [Coniochaeta ligniaria NRRL 30616]|uniref:Secreted protein n=1 Tax=Coniochaeta ligniaria NRRL 30616 TaxID=1408157 RepID=A0A1J7IUU1_9PEZI|nr:hypothetical protein CONLIGDRAFT_299536 [Coniochaeta ligniaria NRRL 30616]
MLDLFFYCCLFYSHTWCFAAEHPRQLPVVTSFAFGDRPVCQRSQTFCPRRVGNIRGRGMLAIICTKATSAVVSGGEEKGEGRGETKHCVRPSCAYVPSRNVEQTIKRLTSPKTES